MQLSLGRYFREEENVTREKSIYMIFFNYWILIIILSGIYWSAMNA